MLRISNQYVIQFNGILNLLREREPPALLIIKEGDDEYSGTVLRHIAIFIGIHYPVFECVPVRNQCIINGEEGFAVIMLEKIRYVFQKNNRGTLLLHYPGNLKKEITARIGKAFLLSGYGEWLTGEPCGKHIKIGDILCVYTSNVRFNDMIRTEVGGISFYSIFIILVCPYHIKPGLYEAEIDSPDSAEKTA